MHLAFAQHIRYNNFILIGNKIQYNHNHSQRSNSLGIYYHYRHIVDMSSKKKTIVESIDNSKSNSSGSGNSSNRNDVKLLMNTLMKIIKSNNDKNAIDDKRETIIDILNQLKYLPLVTVVDIDDNDDDNNSNGDTDDDGIEKCIDESYIDDCMCPNMNQNY